MTATTESEMMSLCCGKEGKIDFDKMKTFMESCGKMDFTEDQIKEMKKICSDHGELCDKMMQFMKNCGCSCQ